MVSSVISIPACRPASTRRLFTMPPILKPAIRPVTKCLLSGLRGTFKGSKVLHLSILKGSFQQARRFGVLIPRPLPLTVSLPHAGDGEIENFNERALGKLKKVDLQKMLNERGLDSKGLKAKLIERLMAFEQGDEPPMQELVVSVARQARGAVAGERKPPPLVKVPVEESAPADMEVMRREIEKLDLATAELSKRIEAATKARQDEKSVLEDIAAEVLATREELASQQALDKALQNADRLKASLQVREKAIQLLQGVVARQAAAVPVEPKQAAPAPTPVPEQAKPTISVIGVPTQPKEALHVPARASHQFSLAQASDTIAEVLGANLGTERPVIPVLEKATAPAALAVSYGSFYIDLINIFKAHTKEDKRVFVDIAGYAAACLLVLKLLI